MIDFVPISEKSRITSVIGDAWKDDQVFFERYAVNVTPEKSIGDTTAKVIEAMGNPGAFFFDMQLSGRSVGYQCMVSGQGINILFSFCVNVAWRCPGIMRAFVSHYEAFFCDCREFYTTVYTKNFRATSFFVKNGFHLESKYVDETDRSGEEISLLKKVRANGSITNRGSSGGRGSGHLSGNHLGDQSEKPGRVLTCQP